MKRSWQFGVSASALAVYSIVLVGIEATGGQDALRPYVTDVEGPVAFYGVNTWLSAGLLLAAAVLWSSTSAVLSTSVLRRVRPFAMLQSGVLLLLAIDDRFLLHERVGRRLDIDDPIVLGVVAVAELAILVRWSDVAAPDRVSRGLLLGAATAFALMLAIDAVGPAELAFRLAAEEVTKVWGGALLAAWAWYRLSSLAAPNHTPAGQMEERT